MSGWMEQDPNGGGHPLNDNRVPDTTKRDPKD